jgi:hypothetical protein
MFKKFLNYFKVKEKNSILECKNLLLAMFKKRLMDLKSF